MKDRIIEKGKKYEYDSVCTDQQLISMTKEEWDSFLKALNAPPKSRPRLEHLMKEKTVLEK